MLVVAWLISFFFKFRSNLNCHQNEIVKVTGGKVMVEYDGAVKNERVDKSQILMLGKK